MPSQVVAPTSSALLRRMQELKGVTNSPMFGALMTNVQRAVHAGNREAALAGVDGRGRPVAPLSPNSRKSGKYKGATGPPRAPFRERSRIITAFRAVWAKESDNTRVLVRYWEDFDSPKGFPIVVSMVLGTPTIPRRDPSAITPQTWGRITRLFSGFWESYTRPR